METDDCNEVFEGDDGVLEIFDINRLPLMISSYEAVDEEIDIYTMTSLGTIMLLEDSRPGKTKDDNLNRLSLAYEGLNRMPKLLIEELAENIEILDISHNEFDNLDFLSEFKQVTTLICDHNKISAKTTLPYMPKLELLWMNHCKISELYPWAKRLQQSCPNLKYLSLMGNSVSPSHLNGGTIYEYLQLFLISLFPQLKHLDDRTVTADQRAEAEKMYKRPLLERFVHNSQRKLPSYLQAVTSKVSNLVCSSSPFIENEKNFIV
ncbi:uncharacterized protein LOC109606101 isoform X2 [Aethina tumida]|uniref:uncharacterized protein LOC109606101 isoform X2 n=1 Tax=Aethina tumida TaxID=116153 RepID=UPI002148C2CF|nr:uncharacterized protein LOC109606101 isoform X2 [Aethina tumida]